MSLRNLDAFVDKVANETVIASHHLEIASDKIVTLDGNSIPLGPFLEVEGTPFDFRKDTGPLEDRWNETAELCGAGQLQSYYATRSIVRHKMLTRWCRLPRVRS